MSIKAVANPSCPKPTIGFPKLKKTKAGDVALFLQEGGSAIILKASSGLAAWDVGRLYPSEAFAMAYWYDFEGTLVLSNEP